jgi:hypothetical protein
MHNGHLQKSQVDITVGDLHVGKTGVLCAGEFIHRIYASDYVLLASTVNDIVDREDGTALKEYAGVPIVTTADCIDCIERPLAAVAKLAPLFLLDFRQATGDARKVLNRDRENRSNFFGFQRFNTLEAYDGIFFIDKATLQIPLR